MENYIVRIYRRDEHDPCKVTGVLESVEQETRQTFFTLNTLGSLLTSSSGTALGSQQGKIKPGAKTTASSD